MKHLFKFLSSLKITLLSLSGLFILILLGTIAQVDYGIHHVQDIYFQSFFVWKTIGPLSFPILPGGYLCGGALTLNLLSFLISKMKWTWNKSGIILIHCGLLVLLIGSGLTGLLSIESQMILEEGETKFYSEDFLKKELAILIPDTNQKTTVYSIPFSSLKETKQVELTDLPFTVTILEKHKSSNLNIVPSSSDVSHGLGRFFKIDPIPFSYAPNQLNSASIIVLIKSETSETKLLLSEEIKKPQSININGKDYQFVLRRTRYYTPYSITLNSFSHDVYLGTSIPKNFSSQVTVVNQESHDDRLSLIYMNHPLRYSGKTFYQASFGKQDTVSVFQVVENPTWLWPYISTLMMALGMFIHFIMLFSKRKKQ